MATDSPYSPPIGAITRPVHLQFRLRWKCGLRGIRGTAPHRPACPRFCL